MKHRRTFWAQLSDTSRINPHHYAYKLSENRLASFTYALAGFGYMFRWQKNIRIMTAITPLVMGMAWWLELSGLAWAALFITITLVWLAEFLNAGIEAAIDLAAHQTYHPMAKVGKDVGAAAVLLASINAILVGLVLFLEPLRLKLGM